VRITHMLIHLLSVLHVLKLFSYKHSIKQHERRQRNQIHTCMLACCMHVGHTRGLATVAQASIIRKVVCYACMMYGQGKAE